MIKKMFGVLILLLFASVAHGQSAFSNSLPNVIVNQTYITCAPVAAQGAVINDNQVCAAQYETLLPAATTFTTFVAVISQPMPTGSSIYVIAEDFTNGNNIGGCNITAGSTTCTSTFSYSAAAGIEIGVKIGMNTSNSLSIGRITWGLQ